MKEIVELSLLLGLLIYGCDTASVLNQSTTITNADNTYNVTLTLDTQNEMINIVFVAPQDNWCGIGFGSTTMSDTYTILYTQAGVTTSQEEYTLGNHARGIQQTTTTVLNSATTINGYTTIEISRAWNVTTTSPNAFTFTSILTSLDIIWAVSTGGISFDTSVHDTTINIGMGTVTWILGDSDKIDNSNWWFEPVIALLIATILICIFIIYTYTKHKYKKTIRNKLKEDESVEDIALYIPKITNEGEIDEEVEGYVNGEKIVLNNDNLNDEIGIIRRGIVYGRLEIDKMNDKLKVNEINKKLNIITNIINIKEKTELSRHEQLIVQLSVGLHDIPSNDIGKIFLGIIQTMNM